MSPEELKAKREKYGLSQRELAAAIGCSQPRIYEWENSLRKMGNAYDRILRQFFFDLEEKKNKKE